MSVFIITLSNLIISVDTLYIGCRTVVFPWVLVHLSQKPMEISVDFISVFIAQKDVRFLAMKPNSNENLLK